MGGRQKQAIKRPQRQLRPRAAKTASSVAPRGSLVFGLVGAVGTRLADVQAALETELKEFGYTTAPIRLSKLILDISREGQTLLGRALRSKNEDERILDAQEAGDRLRDLSKTADAVALLACIQMMNDRASRGDVATSIPERAYILNSLKNPREVETLRSTYGDGFILIAAYAPRNIRRDEIERRIASSRGDEVYQLGGKHRAAAEEVMRRDEFGADPMGQDVRDTFAMADVFVDAAREEATKRAIGRITRLLFGDPFLSPTMAEQSMYFARSAGLRSASLHRQVGAALVTSYGDVLGLGCNEVPKAGGGQYWADDETIDARDFTLGGDVSREKKKGALGQLLDRFMDAGVLQPDTVRRLRRVRNRAIEELMVAAKGTRLADSIEFYRETHAEMAAMLSAARVGASFEDLTLFTTTFPCHECTRHIVAAGVSRVVYIEPYPKSLGPELHKDAVVVDNPKDAKGKVSLEPFVGVGPRIYERLFQMRQRKEADGTLVEFRPLERAPLFRFQADWWIEENARVLELKRQLVRANLLEK